MSRSLGSDHAGQARRRGRHASRHGRSVRRRPSAEPGDFRECTPVAGLAMMDRGSSRSAKGAVAMVSTAGGPLSGLRVIEVSGELGRFAGKILAESGASVARVGRPSSGPAMRDADARRARRPARLVVRGRQARRRHRPRTAERRRRLPPAGRVGRPRDRHHSRRVASPSSASTATTSPAANPAPGAGVADAVRAHRARAPAGRPATSSPAPCRGVLSISGTPDEAIGAWGRQNLTFGSLMACICGLAGVYAVPRDRPRRCSSTSRCTR